MLKTRGLTYKSEANKHLLDFKNLRELRLVDDITKLYTWKRKLGNGQYGTVHEAFHIKA